MHLTLGRKLAAVIGLLVAVAVGIALFAVRQAVEERERAAATDTVWNAGLQALTLAQAIEHAVVQATAVYTADDTDAARTRFAGLQAALAEVERARPAFLAAMDPRIPPERRRKLDLAVKEFVAYQTETAELGQTLSPRAALIQATDEATVRNRERMVVEINAIGRDVLTHIATQRVEAADARESAMWALSIVPACALGLGLLSALWIVTTQIQRPLLRLKGTLQGIARDRLGEAVPFTGRRDEIGEMAHAVAAVRAALLEKRALDDANVQRQSRDHGRSVMLAEATEAFEVETKRSVTALTRSAEDMRGAADILSETVATATAGTALVASASSQAAGVVNSIASAAEELSSSAKEIEGRVRRTSDIADVALDGTRGLQDAVGSLAQAASEIGTVVSLIRSVADQTNLLALNAAIEAARAGAAGRGFAVVASEVKALAGQTALATDRIGAQVSAIQTATESTAAAIDAIGDTIAQMNTIAAEVTAAADQQERASQEIARAIAGAASDAQTISDTIGGVRETAASNEAQAAHVRDGAATVHEGARTLQRAVETFLRRMNAA